MAESLHNLCLGAGLLQTKKMAKEAAERGEPPRTSRVKITACTEPSRGPPGSTDVIVYPEVYLPRCTARPCPNGLSPALGRKLLHVLDRLDSRAFGHQTVPRSTVAMRSS